MNLSRAKREAATFHPSESFFIFSYHIRLIFHQFSPFRKSILSAPSIICFWWQRYQVRLRKSWKLVSKTFRPKISGRPTVVTKTEESRAHYRTQGCCKLIGCQWTVQAALQVVRLRISLSFLKLLPPLEVFYLKKSAPSTSNVLANHNLKDKKVQYLNLGSMIPLPAQVN